MTGVALAAWWNLRSLSGSIGTLVDKDFVKTSAVGDIVGRTALNAANTMQLFVETTPEGTAKVRAAIDVQKKAITAQLETLERLAYRPEGKAMLVEIKPLRAAYVAAFTRTDALLTEGKRDEATPSLTATTVPALAALGEKLRALEALQRETAQGNGIAQVNQAVSEMDRTTQQDAALVEESAAAAQSLNDQAVRLAQVVSVFRLQAAH